jgi:hypothetical protein
MLEGRWAMLMPPANVLLVCDYTREKKKGITTYFCFFAEHL